MASYLIKADKFFLPGGVALGGYLKLVDGKFGTWTPAAPEGVEIRDFTGGWIAPGMVDTHIHGFFGHATIDGDVEGMVEASENLAKFGTTSWLPTTFTDGVEHIGECCAAIAEAAKSCQAGSGRAHMQGIYLEGPFFTMKHVGAQNPAFLVDPSYEVFRGWQERAGGMIRKSALAPERDGSVDYIAALDAEGIVTCIGHTDATYDEALAAVNAGATCFVHTYNGQRGLHHRDPGVVGCAMSTSETYAEIICDGKHVRAAAIESLLRAKGWQHTVLITDCLGCGGLPEGNYMSGGMPVVLADGLCYLRNEDGTRGNIAGSVLTLAKGVKNIVDWGLASADEAIRMATEVPARSARIDDVCGSIKPGRDADFVVFDHELNLRETFLAGESVGAPIEY
ncbi:N-acetylglucosamine-6-phosphate deacetylase [uncultured Parolsenella sp.]|uniref:N-acetylglucosamine-6-phosphate deacetylase n=1 Tax=uncultured Parolsenella sp. TaxID=2083008 RepID=UPI0025FDA647|nr:N-acetylglucosamine-6-phosphate deacetylase [uncultured Parolsenella sp.]